MFFPVMINLLVSQKPLLSAILTFYNFGPFDTAALPAMLFQDAFGCPPRPLRTPNTSEEATNFH